MSLFSFGMVVGMFVGLGLSIFFRWAEDHKGFTFGEYLDIRAEWVKERNEGNTKEGFDTWIQDKKEKEWKG